MCFSLTASFVAGTSLTAVGVVTVKKTKKKSEVPLAFIPLLFGVQQLTEGFVWLSFRLNASFMNTVSTYLYSFIAYLLWPLYAPFAIRSLETVQWRRRLLFLFQLVGVFVVAYLLYTNGRAPVVSEVVYKCIVYSSPNFYAPWLLLFYFIPTCGSFLISSNKLINIIGVLTFIFALIARWYYTVAFTSVWCYFAAILSILIYLYFIDKISWRGRTFSISDK